MCNFNAVQKLEADWSDIRTNRVAPIPVVSTITKIAFFLYLGFGLDLVVLSGRSYVSTGAIRSTAMRDQGAMKGFLNLSGAICGLYTVSSLPFIIIDFFRQLMQAFLILLSCAEMLPVRKAGVFEDLMCTAA